MVRDDDSSGCGYFAGILSDDFSTWAGEGPESGEEPLLRKSLSCEGQIGTYCSDTTAASKATILTFTL